jgi:hypothetical protein
VFSVLSQLQAAVTAPLEALVVRQEDQAVAADLGWVLALPLAAPALPAKAMREAPAIQQREHILAAAVVVREQSGQLRFATLEDAPLVCKAVAAAQV